MEELTISDCEILTEALSSWETNTGGLVGELMIGMLATKEMREKPEFLSMEEERKAKDANTKRTRAEASILLKAKLIAMKNQIIAASV